MNKTEILAFMNANPTCYLATVEGNAPRVRALGIYKVSEEEIIIQTNVTKDLNKQMLQNPNIELLFFNKQSGMNQIRVRGTVEPVKDPAMLKKVLEDRPFLKEATAQGNGPALFRVKKPLAYVWNIETNYAPKAFVSLY
jgi:pyridoxamine 5'-phosphate oxidase